MLKIAGYDREKLVPGYKGKFLIQLHKADKAGIHFDLRLEFPVVNLHESLGQYEGKRLPGTSEPMQKYPDKPGTVLRSFAVRKHKIPSGSEKLFIVETEDHPSSYFSFSGEITEGYGKGTVEKWDHGTYELLDVEGDKKYTIEFHGDKLKGIFTFVKYQNGYLWLKTKKRTSNMKLITDALRIAARNLIAAPPEPDVNQDPQELFKQIRPLLNKLALGALADASKTTLMTGQTKGKNSLYCVYLRRGTEITPDILNRLKRNEDFFDSLKWSAKAMMLYLWWPYSTPAVPGAPAVPAAPGAPI